MIAQILAPELLELPLNFYPNQPAFQAEYQSLVTRLQLVLRDDEAALDAALDILSEKVFTECELPNIQEIIDYVLLDC